MAEELLITTLEMDSPDQLARKLTAPKTIKFSKVDNEASDDLRRLLNGIGEPYGWTECRWDETQWHDWLAYNRLRWFINIGGKRAGLLEVEDHASEGTEIVYFGFLPQFVGHGFGSAALTIAVELAWEVERTKADSQRVWLHTASRDDPNALRVYVRRGFRVVKQEITTVD